MAYDKDAELALIAKARDGDGDAYGKLVQANQDRMKGSRARARSLGHS